MNTLDKHFYMKKHSRENKRQRDIEKVKWKQKKNLIWEGNGWDERVECI